MCSRKYSFWIYPLEYFARCYSYMQLCFPTRKKLFERLSKRKQETKDGLWKSYRPKHTNTHPAQHTPPHCFWLYSIGVFCKMLLNQLCFYMETNFLKGSQRENKKQKMVGGNLTVPNTQIHTQPNITPPPPLSNFNQLVQSQGQIIQCLGKLGIQ
jgi:hypothetical protein